jgi:hypothetical protein
MMTSTFDEQEIVRRDARSVETKNGFFNDKSCFPLLFDLYLNFTKTARAYWLAQNQFCKPVFSHCDHLLKLSKIYTEKASKPTPKIKKNEQLQLLCPNRLGLHQKRKWYANSLISSRFHHYYFLSRFL